MTYNISLVKSAVLKISLSLNLCTPRGLCFIMGDEPSLDWPQID